MSTLDLDQKTTIIKALEGPITIQAGTDIIKQGDEGDVFYLLQEGTVEVFTRRGRNAEVLTHTYESGSTFGELSLLYNSPRAATCRAKTDCIVWTLDRLFFRVCYLFNLSKFSSILILIYYRFLLFLQHFVKEKNIWHFYVKFQF